jgi:hypothetical protein
MTLKLICIYKLLMGKPAPDSRPKLKTCLLIVQPTVKIAFPIQHLGRILLKELIKERVRQDLDKNSFESKK